MGARRFSPTFELSRTVGWFTSLYPVRLDPGPLDIEEAMAGGAALGRALKLIKEQLQAVPDHGLGFGLLRYLNAQTGTELRALSRPQLGFNYLGRFRRRRRTGALRPKLQASSSGHDPAMRLAPCARVKATEADGRPAIHAQRHLVARRR